MHALELFILKLLLTQYLILVHPTVTQMAQMAIQTETVTATEVEIAGEPLHTAVLGVTACLT